LHRPPAPILVACPDCDLLQHVPRDGSTDAALCVRCRAPLRKPVRLPHEVLLALTIAGLLLLLLAGTFPLASLTVRGQAASTSLPDAVAALWSDGMPELAVLVALTTLAAPAAELLALAYVLAHLRARSRPRHAVAAMRFLHAVEEWNMVEVFVLGALVALIKLGDYAEVHFDIALWCLGAAMLLTIVVGMAFDAEAAWASWEPRA
jgi:paraquat-inducible protein A